MICGDQVSTPRPNSIRSTSPHRNLTFGCLFLSVFRYIFISHCKKVPEILLRSINMNRWTVILLFKIMIEIMFWSIDVPIWKENTIENVKSSYKFLAYINQCCPDLLEMCSKSVKFDGSLGLQKTTNCITRLLFICLWVG